jgi:hypothetical protein
MALTIAATDSFNASRISLSSTVIVLGMPSMRLLPASSLNLHGHWLVESGCRSNLNFDLFRHALPDQEVIFAFHIVHDGLVHVIASNAQSA